MKDTEILKILNDVFIDVFDDNSIKLNRKTTASDIEEWDSLNQIKIILSCEKKFNILLNSSEINELANIGEMIDHLKKLKNL